MKKFGAKHLVSAVVATATVVSVGCIAMADEIEKTVDEAADAVAVVEETAETEEVQAQEEEDAVIVDTAAVVADETEEVVAEVAEAAEEEAVEAVEDEIVYEVDEEIVSEEADYAITNGWYQNDYGEWYYYKNGSKVTGWQKIDGKYYFFYSDGEMATGGRYDSEYKAYFIFGIKGDMQTGWVEYNDSWYYCDPKTGKAVTGWKQIEGNYYYFNNSASSPYMYRNGKYTISNELYLFSSTGEMLTGWQNYYGDWYYFNKSSGKAYKGWNKIGNEWYYFSEYSYNDPYMYTGISEVADDKGNYFYYFFDNDGVLKTNGWQNNGSKYDVYIDDELVYSGYEGNWYYTNKNGRCLTGWQQIDGKWYYFYSSGRAASGCIQDPDSKKYYYFDPETYAMVTSSWVVAYSYYSNNQEVNQYMYVGKNGAAYRGWNKISNEWYYFGPGDSTEMPLMQTGKRTISNVIYIFGEDGAMRKGGWCQYNKEYYYTDGNGAVFTGGWKTIGGKSYYFDGSGVMATGLKYIGGTLRDFGKDGACRNPV